MKTESVVYESSVEAVALYKSCCVQTLPSASGCLATLMTLAFDFCSDSFSFVCERNGLAWRMVGMKHYFVPRNVVRQQTGLEFDVHHLMMFIIVSEGSFCDKL